MFCKYCGKKLKDTAKFCSGCGREMKPQAAGTDGGAQPFSPYGEKTEEAGRADRAQPDGASGVHRVQCKNGHFFDQNKMSVCPVCGEGMAESEQPQSDDGLKGRVRNVWNKFTEKVPFGTSGNDRTVELKKAPYMDQTFDSDNTQTHIPGEEKTGNPLKKEPRADTAHAGSDDGTGSVPQSSSSRQPSAASAPSGEPEEQDVHTRRLQEEVNSTMGWDDEQNRTLGRYHTASSPVVGWLICLKGVHQGEGFPLREGQNNVGRSKNMDVVLSGDDSISREKQVIITYEPKKRVFYIQQGESLTYLNNEPILVPKEMKAYDQIQMGKSCFLFYPLCGESFTWDDYIEVED